MEELDAQAPAGVDEFGDTETHPLENPVVLGRLFELIPFQLEDFKSFRLVSRAWNQCSLSTWRNNAWLSLQDSKSAPAKEDDDSEYEDVDSEDDEDDEEFDFDDDEDFDFDDDEDFDFDDHEDFDFDDHEDFDFDDDDEDVDFDDEDVNSNDDKKTKGITRQEYLQLVEKDQHQLAQHPFRKFTLRFWKIDLQSTNSAGEEDQTPFWNRVGPLMTHLDLNLCAFARVADFRTIIFEATSNLRRLSLIHNTYTDERPANMDKRLDPKLAQHAVLSVDQVQNNLVELNVELFSFEGGMDSDEEDEVSSIDDEPWVDYLPITWMELFIHFPNIKKLGRLRLAPTKVEEELFEFFMSLEVLRREHGVRYLSGLRDLDMFFPAGLICHINSLQFPLQRLTLGILRDMDEQVFKQLLQYPLEYLCVDRQAAAKPFRNFPFGLKFPALKELILDGYIVPNLMFLKECPNLELLKYTPYYEGRLDVDLKHVVTGEKLPRLEKMKSLEMDGDGCSAAEIMTLGKIMPNLRSLEVGLDNDSFRAVCRVWKELEQLTIAPFRVGEEGLLGMDERGGEKFRHPNLTDLRNLRMFEMEDIKMPRDRRGLTKDGILDGIMALPNLEVVELCISSEVTLEVRNQLGKRFPNCSISIQESRQGGNKSAAIAAAVQLERNVRMGAL